jgi:hypothetical protein
MITAIARWLGQPRLRWAQAVAARLIALVTRVGQRLARLLAVMQAVVPWLIGLAFVAVEIRRISGQIAVRYPDFFPWSERAARFDLHHFSQWEWVNGLYPLGYSLLLRLGVELGLDVLRTGFALSIIGGFLGLLGTFWLVRRTTGNWTLAVFCEAFLGCMAFYLFFANLDATDMLAAGLQIVALALLLGDVQRRSVALGAGLLAGLSYLIRYTASFPILLSALFLLGLALTSRKKSGFVTIGIYLLGAMIGALPQLVASTVIKGNPFYTEQAHNLWFHLMNSSDYIHTWRSVPMDISLWEVIFTDPGRFFGHWWEVLRSSWMTGDAIAVDTPLGTLVMAGWLVAALLPGILVRRARAFLALYTVGTIALLSFTRLDRRFLITLMPFQVLCAVYFLWSALPVRVRIHRLALPVRIPILLMLAISYLGYPLNFMNANPRDEQIVEVSNTLHAAGMQSASEVFSTQLEYHDVADRWKRRFDMAAALAPAMASYDELLNFLHARGYRFFIFDRQTGVSSLYPNLEWLLYPENRPAGLTPVYVDESRNFDIYRVEGNGWPAPHPINATLENGIALTGYDLYRSNDAPPGSGRRVGLYLHWKATAPIGQWLKVFVHVMDANGNLVAQHDGLPALWTYPTNSWAVGEEVVDFHPLLFDAAQGDGLYTIRVGLYDPGSGQRVSVLDASGAPAGDHVVLETFTFDR